MFRHCFKVYVLLCMLCILYLKPTQKNTLQKTNKYQLTDATLTPGDQNIAKFQLIIWKKTGLYGYVYYFSVDYDAYDNSDADDILDINKYLRKRHDTK